jgi:hypothetical protein
MRDTRHLFNDLCSRKETSWDSQASPETLDDERMRALMKLPRKQVAWNSSPMDHIFPGMNEPLEWVVERMGDGDDELQYFYVNNEGYFYARYAFRFTPRPV